MTLAPIARRLVVSLVAALSLATGAVAVAAPEGTLTIGIHFTAVPRWLDPAEGESTITPYLLLYALHDGLLEPMPGVGSGPGLAESWSMATDMAGADFTLRAAKFHNGVPVTAEDVKFSFERYRGGGARALKDNVKEILTPAPNRVREALLRQMQRILHEQVTQAPVYHLGFRIGVGPGVNDIMASAIPASTCRPTRT